MCFYQFTILGFMRQFCSCLVCFGSIVARDDVHLGTAVSGKHRRCFQLGAAQEERGHTHLDSRLVHNRPTCIHFTVQHNNRFNSISIATFLYNNHNKTLICAQDHILLYT